MIGELGAIKAIDEEMKKSNSTISADVKLYAYSAGALVLLAYVCELTAEQMLELYAHLADVQMRIILEKGSLSPTLIHFESFKHIFKKCPHAYQKMNERRCRVGVTTANGFVFYKNFTSNEHLAEIMLASYHIPLFCTYDSKLDGRACIDGGILFERDRFVGDDPQKTLLIRNCLEPEPGSSHVSVEIPPIFIFIPIPSFFQKYFFDQGYERTRAFLKHPLAISPITAMSILNNIADLIWWMRFAQPVEYTYDDLITILSTK